MIARIAGWVAALVLTGSVVSAAGAQPPAPDWQTDAAACAWDWQSGGGIGFWAERCDLGGARWAVAWDAVRGAFVQTRDGIAQGVVVQPLRIGSGPVTEAIHAALVAAGGLDATAPCRVVATDGWPMPRTMAAYALVPHAADALAMTASGEVPDPVCGPYGVSTHGQRFIVGDPGWVGLAVFVDVGQERPMFDPASLSVLP